MPLSVTDAVAAAMELREMAESQRHDLDLVQDYLRDDPDKRQLGGLPPGTPTDVMRLSRFSRVNLLKYVVASRVQGMYVDGYQTPDSPEDLEIWRDGWQANRMDVRQIGVHRATAAFGKAYTVVYPGRRGPVIRGASPRQLTVGMPADDDDADWPALALWRRGSERRPRWWLLDDESIYRFGEQDGRLVPAGTPEPHGATYERVPVCPVVRFRQTDDLDDPDQGIVRDLIPLQDQVNITTFGLMVAQHYGAFRQLVILGWIAENADEALKRGAARLLMFEDGPQDVSVEALPQTDLRGYIESRQATIRYLATISQTPVDVLIGEVVNLSAEALQALRASHQSAINQNRMMAGESWEQTLGLAGEMDDIPVDPQASVIWRDTRVQSLEQAAAGLGALVRELGIPPRPLWRRVPDTAQHELAEWAAEADRLESADPLAGLTRTLDRQAGPPVPAGGGGGAVGGG